MASKFDTFQNVCSRQANSTFAKDDKIFGSDLLFFWRCVLLH
jgi:hypothetical protein